MKRYPRTGFDFRTELRQTGLLEDETVRIELLLHVPIQQHTAPTSATLFQVSADTYDLIVLHDERDNGRCFDTRGPSEADFRPFLCEVLFPWWGRCLRVGRRGAGLMSLTVDPETGTVVPDRVSGLTAPCPNAPRLHVTRVDNPFFNTPAHLLARASVRIERVDLEVSVPVSLYDAGDADDADDADADADAKIDVPDLFTVAFDVVLDSETTCRVDYFERRGRLHLGFVPVPNPQRDPTSTQTFRINLEDFPMRLSDPEFDPDGVDIHLGARVLRYWLDPYYEKFDLHDDDPPVPYHRHLLKTAYADETRDVAVFSRMFKTDTQRAWDFFDTKKETSNGTPRLAFILEVSRIPHLMPEGTDPQLS